MSKKIYCKECNKGTNHDKESTSHLLHFIVTICFVPWLFVWVYLAHTSKYKCKVCGTTQL